MPDSRYFKVLDSWRGIAACMVATLHFPAYSHLIDYPFFKNAWIFVDFFFVLSGFIIATNYQKPLLEGFSVFRFMLLRVGRLFPLYFTVLFFIIAGETLHYIFDGSIGGSDSDAFPRSFYNLLNLTANFTLAAGLGIPGTRSILGPSWSISTEFYTYLAFSFFIIKLRQKYWIALLIFIALLPIPILTANSDGSGPENLSGWVWFVRCIYSFSFGILLLSLFTKFEKLFRVLLQNKSVSLFAEIFSCCLVFYFISITGSNYAYGYVFAPYVFAILIIIFSLETGAISKILSRPAFRYLGKLSYSIYMIHSPIFDYLTPVFKILQNFTGVQVFASSQKIETLVLDWEPVYLLGTELWEGDLYFLFFFLIIISISHFFFKYIEKPARSRFKSFINSIYSHENKSAIIEPIANQ